MVKSVPKQTVTFLPTASIGYSLEPYIGHREITYSLFILYKRTPHSMVCSDMLEALIPRKVTLRFLYLFMQ